MQRLTPHQKKVMARLQAGEHLCWNYRTGTYQFSGGGKVANQTFRALEKAKLIRALIDPEASLWVATAKGDGDDTQAGRASDGAQLPRRGATVALCDHSSYSPHVPAIPREDTHAYVPKALVGPD